MDICLPAGRQGISLMIIMPLGIALFMLISSIYLHVKFTSVKLTLF
jgi:hypothetical protein